MGKEGGAEVVDGKIKGEGRMAPKCARPLSGARPSGSAGAIQPSRREGRLRAVTRWCKTAAGRALDQSRDWTRGCSVTPKPDDRHLIRVFADALLKLVVDAGSEPSQIPHVGDAPGPMRHRY